MSYKRGLSKSRFKDSMRMFWTNKWKYERTPEEWVESLRYDNIWSSPASLKVPVGTPYGTRSRDLLSSAIDKLVLEKKMLKDEGERLQEMINSPDLENALVAITIMAQKKPKKFKKVLT